MRSSTVRLLSGGVAAALALAAELDAQSLMRVSVDSFGAQSDNFSGNAVVSADARYVAFLSNATNLVAGDTNLKQDVFVHDRQTGITTRASVHSSGAEANDDCDEVAISADGRFVAFSSAATNLVAGDTNAKPDVFVRDLQLGTTARVSVDSFGAEGVSDSTSPSLSTDGRYVAFSSYANNLVAGDGNIFSDIFVRDLQSGTTTRVSLDSGGAPSNGHSDFPSISGDGTRVAFRSLATDLVASDTNGTRDFFVRDITAGTTVRVNVDSSGAQSEPATVLGAPSISADGSCVAFCTEADNLVAGDTNSAFDVFVRELASAVTTRESVNSSGTQAGSGGQHPALSSDGRFVAFHSSATNLAVGDTNGTTDVFFRDRLMGTTVLASGIPGSLNGNGPSSAPAIASDGREVVFESSATNLIAGDTNGFRDVFVSEPVCEPVSYCTSKTNSSGCLPVVGWSGYPSASAGSGFLLLGEQVLPGKAGIFFYSTHGPGGTPFHFGTLCATFPVKRSPLQTSSSTGALPCTGVFTYDFNVRIATGADLALVEGQQVWSQYWSRDAGGIGGDSLTNGLTFFICP